MNKIAKIAKHEFKKMAMTKAYLVFTLLGPILLLAVTIVPTLLARNSAEDQNTTVGIYNIDQELQFYLEATFNHSDLNIVYSTDEEELKRSLLDGDIKGYVVLPMDFINSESYNYYSQSGSEIMVYETLNGILGQLVFSMRLSSEGYTQDEIAEFSQKPQIKVIQLDNDGIEGESQDFMGIMFTCIAFMMLIYMTVMLYGQMIGRSVVNEKITKTVEILLSSVKPLELLYGKILGIGLAGLLQYLIWISMSSILTYVVAPIAGLAIPITLSLDNLGFLLLFFILGFFLYSAAYAALGSGAEDESHLSQLGLPLLIFLITPMVMVSTFVMNPDGMFSMALSIFPLTAPMVMLIRIVASNPPIWQIALSIGLLLITIAVIVSGASKIFRVGILMTGKRVSLKEILKWMQVK